MAGSPLRLRLTAAATCALMGAIPLPTLAEGRATETVSVRPGVLPLVREIDDRFMSFQIGFSHLTGGETWKSYDDLPDGSKAAQEQGFAAIREARAATDLSHPKLRSLTRALAPLYLRYSGTTANSVYFHDSDAPPPPRVPDGFTVILTRAAWKGAVDFAEAVDAKILTSFANSPGVRNRSGIWTPRMAAPWLAYTKAIGGEIYAAELFNEPNAPEPPRRKEGNSPDDFARDFAAFRSFVGEEAPAMKIAGPGNAVLGIPVPVPSLDRISPEDYAGALPAPRFDIVSYHFYPALAERCAPAASPQGISADRALSEDWLSRPDAALLRFKALRDRHAPDAAIWITETGGAACGGLRWQPTFLDAFRFVDTHARLARDGADAMFTHALISGSNGIIDEKTLEPNASYWAAVLWKRLVGARVLDVGPARPGLHLYAHCLRGVAGGVTLVALNIEDKRTVLHTRRPANAYRLTAPDLQGKSVELNGQTLSLTDKDELPPMPPERNAGGRIELAPKSITFVALPEADNAQCRVNAQI